jgi:hypothetical protein
MKIIQDARTLPRQSQLPRELLSVVLHQLYFDHPRELYHQHKAQGSFNWIESIVKDPPTTRTPLYEQLEALLPLATEAHLYVSVWESSKPTHFLSLIKIDNIWRPRHPKIRAVGNLTSYGVVVAWRNVTPVPEVAIDITPTLLPLLRGKAAYESLTPLLNGNYIVHEEMRQCTLLARMFGRTTKRRVSIFMPSAQPRYASARISYEFDSTPLFSNPRIARTVAYPTTRYHIRTTDAPIEFDCPAPFSIVPSIPQFEPDEFPAAHHNLLESLLKKRIVPFVGHLNDKRLVDIYALSNTFPVKIITDRAPKFCNDIPYFFPWSEHPGVWVPNPSLATTLFNRLTTTLEPYYVKATIDTMPYFGATLIESFNPKVFARYDLELSPDQLTRIIAIDNPQAPDYEEEDN